MTITQTVEIPADRRITLEVPAQIPAGKVILSFTPVMNAPANVMKECPLCEKYRDPETGELRYNAETVAAIEEGRAILRGEIPAKRFNSLAEMWEDLEREDPED